MSRSHDEFRDYYNESVRDSVKQHYYLNHVNQTVDFVRKKHAEFDSLSHKTMGIWEALEYLNTLVDDSDPDTTLPQIQHALQVAEKLKADGQPRWFILTGLIHDLGKVLCLFDEPQWAVVGDTFPVGCRFSSKIIYPDYFADNPDAKDPRYNTKLGIYTENGGLDQVLMSWGHDEYLYQVVKAYLPQEALYIIRYHSFYPCHRDGEYTYLMNDHDKKMFEWVKKFNAYDLYTKAHQSYDVEKLKPYYQALISEFFPEKIHW